MELELVQGCICDSLTVDGNNEIDLDKEEKIGALDRIFNYLKKDIETNENSSALNELLQWFIPVFCEEYECSDKPCECCGDIIRTYRVKI